MAALSKLPKGRKTKVKTEGGPFGGGFLYLQSPSSGTLTFTLNGHTGRYVLVAGILIWKDC